MIEIGTRDRIAWHGHSLLEFVWLVAIPVSQSAKKIVGPTRPDGNSEMPRAIVQKCDVSGRRKHDSRPTPGAAVSRIPARQSSCIVEFVQRTRVEKERAFMPGLPVVQNGPPGPFVTFTDGRRVPLPTDQIVFAEDSGGAARVGFGGMDFDGIEGGLLTFFRVRDLVPEHELSPERGRRMTLEPKMIAIVFMEGRLAWGRPMAR